MAEVQEKDKGGKKKGKQKKMHIHVDFTPMVDMNMLLICFFMLATTMSKPQTMEISMPTNDKVEKGTQISELRAVTVLPGGNNELYYYVGQPDYENLSSLKQTNYTASGLRAFLISRNKAVVEKLAELRQKRQNLEITEQEYDEQSAEIKKDKSSPIVVIKPSDQSNYKNLIDVLDEMQICGISIYAIVDITEEDVAFIENAKSVIQIN